MYLVAWIVLFLSLINLVRLALFSIGSDIFDVVNYKKVRSRKLFFKKNYSPLVTVIVPAHNEEGVLKRNLLSIANSSYKQIEVIVVNDSSSDKTEMIARSFQRQFRKKLKSIRVFNIKARGKAKALNYGLRFAKGSLFMCLDADSALTENALKVAVESFREKSLGGLASNVKIFPGKGVLNLLQRIEYLLGYQMKKAEAMAKVQYIIGGIGSMYRTQIIRRLGYYETDTITEDIDLSMKMIELYGLKKFVGYNPSMVVFTEATVTPKDFFKQRFRWKYGRYQVFFKRHRLFWSINKKYSRFLSWIYLPYALFAELTFTLEPLTIAFIFYLIFVYGSLITLIGSIATFCFYSIIQITGATQGYALRERLTYAALAPVTYFLIYILSSIEYLVTIYGLFSLRKITTNYFRGSKESCEWIHVERPKASAQIG